MITPMIVQRAQTQSVELLSNEPQINEKISSQVSPMTTEAAIANPTGIEDEESDTDEMYKDYGSGSNTNITSEIEL